MLRTSVTVSHFLTQKPLKPWEKEDARQMLSGAMPKKGAKVNLAGYFDTLRLPNRKWCFHVLSFFFGRGLWRVFSHAAIRWLNEAGLKHGGF